MYLGCKIHPTSLLAAQPIYLSTAVVFALYSIRGYRITAGLFLGGVVAHYFSPLSHEYAYIFSKIVSAMANTVQILFCAFFMRFILDKLHMALVSMRKSNEMIAFVILSIFVPQLVFNFLMTPSLTLMVTGLGHTLGLLTISSVFLVWDAYVPKLSPPPMISPLFILVNILWVIIGSVTYVFCHSLYNLTHPIIYPDISMFFIGYLIAMMLLILILAKMSNRFMTIIGMGFMGLSVLFYAILHPDIVHSRELNTAYIQIGVIFISAFWLTLIAKLR